MKEKHSFDVVFVLLLFLVFTAAVLMVLISGASAYKNISASVEEQFQERTCLNYISTKLRHYNADGSVYITELGGVPALALTETVDEETFVTYIYLYGGCVRELYMQENVGLPPDAGDEIIEAKNIEFSMPADNIIRVECTGSDGGTSELFISLCGEGGGEE